MSIVTEQRSKTAPATPAKLGIFDSDIHPTTKDANDIRVLLPSKWHNHYDHYRDFMRKPYAHSTAYPRAARALARRDAWPPTGGLPGSDLDFMREHHLDPLNIQCGVLQVLAPAAIKLRHPAFAEAMCSAVNDWQVEAWTSRENRLKGSIVVPQEDAAASIVEIERLAGMKDFCQVFLAPRGDEPLGRPRYWPIYEAASHHNLAIALHAGGDNGYATTPSGHASFFIEQRESHVSVAQAVIASMIFEGVPERFPDLRIITVEAGGVGWVPALGWRMDHAWQRMKDEVPHLKMPPSEYLKRNFWFTSQPIDEPENPADLRKVFDLVGWDRILFATDYPHWDFDDPKYAVKFEMNPEEKRLFFHDNAEKAYGMAA